MVLLSNGIGGCCQVVLATSLPFPGGLPPKMAAAARPGPGVEELVLLEKLLGLPKGSKYGVQGERKVKGARRGWQRAGVHPPSSPAVSYLAASPPTSPALPRQIIPFTTVATVAGTPLPTQAPSLRGGGGA